MLLLVSSQRVPAAMPEQFRVWGSVGKESPPLPAGWREIETEKGFPAPQPSPEERQRGFILFSRDPFLPVDADAVPAASERTTEIMSFAAPGQYEALALSLYALDDLVGLESKATELRSSAGGVIPADHLDLRVVRSVPVVVDADAKTFRREPFLIEKRPVFSVAKSHSAVLWLTFKVPAGTPAGEYRGTWSVQHSNQTLAQGPLSVTVLPFSLPELSTEVAMWYSRPAESDEMLMKEVIDLREHGTSVPVPALEVRVRSRDQKFGPDDVAETKAWSQRLLSAIRNVYGGWRFPVTFEAGHQIAFYWNQDTKWFSYWPHSPAIETDLGTGIELMQELAKTNGIPALRAYLSDEPGAHNLLEEAVYYNGWVKHHFPRVATMASIGGGVALGFDEIGRLSDAVDFLNLNRFTPEIATMLLARGKPFGVYNGAGAMPAGARFFFGFYGAKTGARQISQWAYSFGESIFDGNGLRLDDEGYVYHAPDGPLPTLAWEAVRAGIDDARYIELLGRMIAAARASSQPAARTAADDADKMLAGIWRRIGWEFQAMQSGDRTPPPHPATLRKWRRQVAQQILALQKHIGPAVPATVAPARSPLALPWADPAKEEISYGPELLPPSDFEAGWKPWRVEAWRGKGKGTLDPNEHHSGRQSVRIEIPASDGSSAVTVLVWPQYGDGKLNLSLEGGRTYELSAWIKWRDRATPPELRVNLPGNVASLQTGRERPDTNGWQRLWVRTELKAAAQPSYLAIWVQGPGTVWVDDLSLREAISPPLRVALDQDQYDALDHTAVLSVTLGPQAKPSAIRCTLARATSEKVGTLTVPSGATGELKEGILTCPSPFMDGSCHFLFDPSALRLGHYVAKVELLDSENRPFATKETAWERETGLALISAD